MLSEIEKMKEELRNEFFSKSKSGKSKTSKSKPEKVKSGEIGDNPKVELIKKSLSEEASSEGIVMDIVNTIFMHRFQKKRFEQLKQINESRSMYQDTYYAEQFEMLDKHIEDIEEEIFMCTKVAVMAFKYGVKNIVMAAWCKGTIHIDRIRLAFELSAEYRMDLATTVLEDGIKNPNLEMQYTGLIRELALHHSRMAGFQNQKKFGKRPDVDISIRPIQQVSDQQMQHLIDSFREDRKKLREIGEGFDNYVEVKEVVQPNLSNGDSGGIEYNSIDDIIANSKKSKQQNEDNLNEGDFKEDIFDIDN